MTIEALPQILRRDDIDLGGSWAVKECLAVRGEPYTDLTNKEMAVPGDDDGLAKVVRAHELMHAKVSPQDKGPWIARGKASLPFLQAAEEARVNYLVGQIGLGTKILIDGSELVAGERVAEMGDWAGAVLNTLSFMCSGSLNKYLTGVRRHRPEWAQMLRDLSKRWEAIYRAAHKKKELASTGTLGAELVPAGFVYTEKVAALAEHISTLKPREPQKAKSKNDDSGDDDSGDEGDTSKGGDSDDDDTINEETLKDIIKNMKPPKENNPTGHDIHDDHGWETWWPVVLGATRLTRITAGNLGRRRIASNTGRFPKRLQRLLTDPQKRVFERKLTRGANGGVVLIDASGSMNLDMAMLRELTEMAPGCLVVAHTIVLKDHSGGKHDENLWILARNGLMVDEIPNLLVEEYRPGVRIGSINGNDRPAIEWAAQQPEAQGAPLVWVTDGENWIGNGGPGNLMWGGPRSDRTKMECAQAAKRLGAYVATDHELAKKLLTDLRVGRAVKRRWPYLWRRAWKNTFGTEMA